MAEYILKYTSDGVEKKELHYKNEVFSYSMIPDGFGKTGDKKGFEHLVAEKFPDEIEEVIEALEELSFADEDEIEEILTLLENYE